MNKEISLMNWRLCLRCILRINNFDCILFKRSVSGAKKVVRVRNTGSTTLMFPGRDWSIDKKVVTCGTYFLYLYKKEINQSHRVQEQM